MFSIYPPVARPRMRSLATSFHNLAGPLGGLGFGALMVGLSLDYLTPIYGKDAIRYALLLPNGCLFPAACSTHWVSAGFAGTPRALRRKAASAAAEANESATSCLDDRRHHACEGLVVGSSGSLPIFFV